MEQITVNDVRIRLGKIMDVLLASGFNEKYKRGSQIVDVDSTEYVLLNARCDIFVRELSQLLYNKDRFSHALRLSDDHLFVCFYLRYHSITGFLAKQNQDNILQVPAGKKDFFSYMMLDFFGRISAPVST